MTPAERQTARRPNALQGTFSRLIPEGRVPEARQRPVNDIRFVRNAQADEGYPTRTLILKSGFCVMGYRSFTEDVLGQIYRSRLVLGEFSNRVLRLLPAIEEALQRHGFQYRHSGLGPGHTKQMSVLARDGLLYRLAIIPAGEDEEDANPTLHIDTSWIEREDPVKTTEYRSDLELTPAVGARSIAAFVGRVPR